MGKPTRDTRKQKALMKVACWHQHNNTNSAALPCCARLSTNSRAGGRNNKNVPNTSTLSVPRARMCLAALSCAVLPHKTMPVAQTTCHLFFLRITVVCRQRSIGRKICLRDQSLRQVRTDKLSQPLQFSLRPSLVLIHK